MGALKLLVIVPNLIIFGLGCLMIGISANVLRTETKYETIDILNGKVKTAAALGITAGAFLVVVSFLGFCGVVAAKKKLLMAYCAIMAVILIFEVAAAVEAFIYKGQIKSTLEDFLDERMMSYNGTQNVTQPNQMIIVQDVVECCGVRSWRDWKDENGEWIAFVKQETKNTTNGYSPATTTADNNVISSATIFDYLAGRNTSYNYLPATCCGSDFEASESNLNCTAEGVHNTKPMEYEKGCYDKIVDWLPYLGIGIVVIICIQVLILIISCCLQRQIKEDHYIEFF